VVAIFPASAKGGGVCLAFPDVCKVPTPSGPQPLPYPNIAKTAQEAQKSKKKVAGAGSKIVTTRSRLSRSQGAEAGTMKGTIASKNMAKSEIGKIKGALTQLHSKIIAMNSSDPDQWQKALTDYLVAAGALYVTQQNAKD
jgi:hypothetical protein